MGDRQCYYHYPKNRDGSYSGHTLCMIIRDGMIFHGESLCSPNDNFNKSVGRKLAYERAVAASEASKTRSEELNESKNKVKVAYYNVNESGSTYHLKTKQLSNEVDNTQYEVWPTNKYDDTWTESALKNRSVHLQDDGEGVILTFDNKCITLDYSELIVTQMVLHAYNKSISKFSKFKPKRLK